MSQQDIPQQPSDSDYLMQPRRRVEMPTEEQLANIVRRAEQSGELRHLHGKPLDLSDDSPDWFVRKMLRENGFTHPLLERGREVDAVQQEADAIVERLRSYREWLTGPSNHLTASQAHDFNLVRSGDLRRYREVLGRVNKAVRDYNLQAPDALHRRPVLIERTVAAIAEAIPPVDETAIETASIESRPGWRALWRRLFG